MLYRLESWLEANAGYGTTILRLALAIVFLAHGYAAAFVYTPAGLGQFFATLGIPLPGLSAWLLIGVHLGGGAMLLLGLLTRLNALLHAGVMAVATVAAHLPQGFFLTGIVVDAAAGRAIAGGYEYALTLTLASLALAFLGPGRLALDRAVGASARLRPSMQP